MRRKLSCAILLHVFTFSAIAAVDKPNDPCPDVEKAAGYASYIFNLSETDRARLSDYCQLYYGIKNKEPDHINKALAPILERSNGLAFLKDIDFKIKGFEDKDGKSGLGFSYDYTKTNELTDYVYNADKNFTTGMSWVFSARGNVAFDSAINPADFLETKISIAGFRDYGGVSNTEAATAAINSKLNQLDDAATSLEGAALLANREQVKSIVSSFFSDQFYLDYALDAGLESNQRFTQKQWTYGAKFDLEVKGYGKNSTLGWWNIIDYPFALLRVFTGYGNTTQFKPLGSTLPTLAIGIDQVDPVDNSSREAVGETGKFDRAKGEVYFRTPIARISSLDIFANIDYRIWQELSPSQKIKAAGIDNFNYVTFSISSSNGVFVSYSDGKLPFDIESQRIYELGWKINFD